MQLASLAATAAFLGAAALPAHANLVVDGGFEQPAVAAGSYTTRATIPGWTGAPDIEVQNRVAGSPFEGAQFVELDTSGNSAMYQDLATNAGTRYRITFAYSPRPGVDAASNGIAYSWNGVRLGTIAQSGLGLRDTAWSLFDATVVATGPTSRLGFAAIGRSDSFGGYLDAVGVAAIPEPGTVQVFGLGLVVLATVSVGRRRRDPMPASRHPR